MQNHVSCLISSVIPKNNRLHSIFVSALKGLVVGRRMLGIVCTMSSKFGFLYIRKHEKLIIRLISANLLTKIDVLWDESQIHHEGLNFYVMFFKSTTTDWSFISYSSNPRLKIQKRRVNCQIYDARFKKEDLNFKSTTQDWKKKTQKIGKGVVQMFIWAIILHWWISASDWGWEK